MDGGETSKIVKFHLRQGLCNAIFTECINKPKHRIVFRFFASIAWSFFSDGIEAETTSSSETRNFQCDRWMVFSLNRIKHPESFRSHTYTLRTFVLVRPNTSTFATASFYCWSTFHLKSEWTSYCTVETMSYFLLTAISRFILSKCYLR